MWQLACVHDICAVAVPTCLVHHVCWLDLIQVLRDVLCVNHAQHGVQLAGLLQIVIHKEGLQAGSITLKPTV
jgi:hypothetical protein